MIIKEYKAQETGGRTRLFVLVQCDSCNQEYSRQKRFLAETHGCSPKCLSTLKGSRETVACAHCNKPIDRNKSKLEASKSGLHFCDRTCKEEAQKYNKAIQPDHYGTGVTRYREKALEHYGTFCSSCGFDNIKALEVHHKDRDRNNNTIENLEVLCANCHRIEHS